MPDLYSGYLFGNWVFAASSYLTAGFVVCLGKIDLSNLGIVPYHFDGAMTQQRLHSEVITPGTKVGDREGVVEFVGIGSIDPSTNRDLFD